MAFWSDISGTAEPLRQYRWYLRYGKNSKSNLDTIQYALMECGKPEVEITSTEHLLLNHYFKYPGIVKWKPINVKMASVRSKDGDADTSFLINEIINNSGYSLPDDPQIASLSKTGFIDSIAQTIDLVQINADGKEIEIWQLFNPLITNIKYGTLSYSSEEMVTVEFIINYDYARLTNSTE